MSFANTSLAILAFRSAVTGQGTLAFRNADPEFFFPRAFITKKYAHLRVFIFSRGGPFKPAKLGEWLVLWRGSGDRAYPDRQC